MTWLRRLLILIVLAPAVALTALRLLHPDAGWAVRGVAFAPLALGLYALAFLLALPRLIAPRGGRRRGAALLALLTLVGAGAHAWWLAPQFSGTAPGAPADAEPIQVMSANLLRGEADAPSVVEQAVVNDVDVLVLQEVTEDAVTAMERAGLSQAFPEKAGEPGSEFEGTMVFTTGHITEVEPIETGFGSWAMTIQLGDDEPIRLFAVHTLPPTGDATGWRDDLATLRSAVEDQSPDLVVGDLNATVDHAEFTELLGSDLRDAAERANSGWQPTWSTRGMESVPVLGSVIPPLVAIDHVLIGPALTATGTQTVDLADTDHRALLADLSRR